MGDRSRCLQVSLTKDMAQAVRNRAEIAGMSVSTYLRGLIFRDFQRRPRGHIKDGDTDLQQVPTPPACLEETLEKIRGLGWTVAVHHDFRQNGELHTYWLFTKRYWSVKGEAHTDRNALTKVLNEIQMVESRISPEEQWPNSSNMDT
jgi:hypothetical protein